MERAPIPQLVAGALPVPDDPLVVLAEAHEHLLQGIEPPSASAQQPRVAGAIGDTRNDPAIPANDTKVPEPVPAQEGPLHKAVDPPPTTAILVKAEIVRILNGREGLIPSRLKKALEIRNPRLLEILRNSHIVAGDLTGLDGLLQELLNRQNALPPVVIQPESLPKMPADAIEQGEWHVTRLYWPETDNTASFRNDKMRVYGWMILPENRRNPRAALAQLAGIHTTNELDKFLRERGF